MSGEWREAEVGTDETVANAGGTMVGGVRRLLPADG